MAFGAVSTTNRLTVSAGSDSEQAPPSVKRSLNVAYAHLATAGEALIRLLAEPQANAVPDQDPRPFAERGLVDSADVLERMTSDLLLRLTILESRLGGSL